MTREWLVNYKKWLKCSRCPNYIIWPCVLDRVATFSAGDKCLTTCSYKAANENKDASLSDKSWFKPFQFTSVMYINMFCACDKIAYYLMCVVNICPAA